MKRENAKREILLMLFFVLLSLVLLLWVIPSQIKVTPMMESETFTPRTWPYFIAACLLAVSVTGLINNLARFFRLSGEEKPVKKRKKTREEWQEVLFPFFIFLLIAVYGILFRLLGIVAATVIVPPVILWFLRCRNWRMYAVFYGFTAVVYLLFSKVLMVPIH